MTILPAVVKAEYRGDYRIHLTFNDGTAKTVDFQPWLEGPIFEPLRDQRHFREFFVDIAPETLYAATDIRQVA